MKKLLLFSTFLFWLGSLKAQSDFIKQDTVFAQSASCLNGVDICIDSFTYGNLSDYEFLLDGQAFSIPFNACKEEIIHTYFLNTIYQGGETGPFSLQSWSVNGKTFSISKFNNLNQLLDSMRLWDPQGNWQLDTTAQLIFGFPLSGNTYSCQNIKGSRGGDNTICYQDGISYTGLKFKVNSGFHTLIVNDTFLKQRDTIILAAACVQPDIVRQTINTNTTRVYCMNTNQLLGLPVLATFSNICSKVTTHVNFDSLYNYCVKFKALTPGTDTACLRVCDKYGFCDTTYLYVTTLASPNRIHAYSDTLTVGVTRTECNLNTPVGTIKSFRNICPTQSGSEIAFTLDSIQRCVIYTAKKAGIDTACVEVCNTDGLCDTTIFTIRALAIPLGKSYTVYDTIYIDSVRLRCDINKPIGAITVFNNTCSNSSGSNAQFTFNKISQCISYQGISVGVDTACVLVCNDAGSCDTTTFIVETKAIPIFTGFRTHVLNDTISVGLSREFCNFVTPFGASIFENICAGNSGVNTRFNINPATKCITYTGLTAGIDTACIRICDGSGLCDTTIVTISVLSKSPPPTPSTEIINIKLGRDSLFKNIDTLQILGAVDTIYDACPGKNGTHALMVLNRQNRSVQIVGVTIGTDTMCIVVCNKKSGLCDTTTVIAVVTDTISLVKLFANNDFDTITQGRSRIVDVYKNDSLNNKTPTSLIISSLPRLGTADTISFRLGLIKYTANRSPYACGMDSFRYKLCFDTICTEATVFIQVICSDSLKAFNGISPNGDGRNDAFVLEGLQNYPNNMLIIYNRWGNEVHKVKNYENDWQGTWNGKDLPDGTYFFWFRNDDTGEVIRTGYLQILR